MLNVANLEPCHQRPCQSENQDKFFFHKTFVTLKLWGHPLSTYAKFYEKSNISNPLNRTLFMNFKTRKQIMTSLLNFREKITEKFQKGLV